MKGFTSYYESGAMEMQKQDNPKNGLVFTCGGHRQIDSSLVVWFANVPVTTLSMRLYLQLIQVHR